MFFKRKKRKKRLSHGVKVTMQSKKKTNVLLVYVISRKAKATAYFGKFCLKKHILFICKWDIMPTKGIHTCSSKFNLLLID